MLEKAGYKVTTQTVNSGQAKGVVISQTPRGTGFPGTMVTLSVSSGYVPPPPTAEPIEPSAPATTDRPPAQSVPPTTIPPPAAAGEPPSSPPFVTPTG
jgi:beta-lactam-binding protein with PASTA domain